MSLSDELSKLAALKEQGVLSLEEFEQAKKKILSGDGGKPAHPAAPLPVRKRQNPMPRSYRIDDSGDDSVGRAANRYVTFQMVMSVIGIIIFLLFFAPKMCSIMERVQTPGLPGMP